MNKPNLEDVLDEILEELWCKPDWTSDDSNEMADYQEREIATTKSKLLTTIEQDYVLKKTVDGAVDDAIIEYIKKVSTDNRPLDAEPLVKKMPVPCPDCGAEEYYDWYLYPHQVYNQFMPGGIGHFCFPCFAKRAVELHTQAKQLLKGGSDES